ncbi:arginine N-succinyltransferase [Euryhalocaulis caribicus]|uniref:arginine N-succinyltransferase n=1 Tax=Euryhalocaulis caribicus TaxID=1161401 RepID=UPI0003A43419|nr:arginine N-succinyltransferase [Euryhalocaulis caribicus]
MAVRVVRAGGPGDLGALVELAGMAGPGFTSLQSGEEALAARLEKSQASFAADSGGQGDEVFCLMLQEIGDDAVLGTSAVKSQIGVSQPYVNFRVTTAAQFSDVVDRRFDMKLLMLVTECAGATEVGTLFLRQEARGGGMGALISLSRYMLIAAARERFGARIVSELRGCIDEKGRSPFWDGLGRHFFRMDFHEADKLSASLGNQFLWDLLPKHPIHIDLLPDAAIEVIGKTHVDGGGARRLLESQGFEFGGLVDVFDGGPLLSVKRDRLKCLRESRVMTVAAGDPGEGAKRAMISNDRIADFRCALGRVSIDGDSASIPADVADALNIESGDKARVWVTE